MILDDKIASGQVIVLDGATGTEIARKGGAMDGAAWCAVANLTAPDIVRTVHEDYIRAGADVVIANTFATCRHVLAGAGLAERTVEINRRAVELASQARENASAGRPIAVAGSISNTLAWQPGTLSPDPRYLPTPKEEEANYREVAETFAQAGADFIVLEMMLDIKRASRAVRAATATGLPVWLGISASLGREGRVTGWDLGVEERGRLAEGHVREPAPPLADIVDALTLPGCQVAGIMHSSVATTGPALEVLRGRWSGPVMVYPETLVFDPVSRKASTSLSPEEFAQACRGWVEDGVQIVGGCCGTTIEHICAMVDALPERPGRAA